MISLNHTPCSNCINYMGIRRDGKEESTEFISCKASGTGNAKDILISDGADIHCKFQVKEYDM